MAEKYYGENAFVFCNNNSIIQIDPEGKDVWEINRKGEIVNRIKDNTQDAFFIVSVNADGKMRRSQTIDNEGNLVDIGISFEYGTIKNVRTPTVKVRNSEGIVSSTKLTIFEVKGDDRATKLFEFLTNPKRTTKVEWTHAKIGNEKSEGNIVGTGHKQSSTAVGQYLRASNYTLREVIHNHPSGIGKPSQGDLLGAAAYLKKIVKLF